MNLNTQLNEQFDRIFDLVQKTVGYLANVPLMVQYEYTQGFHAERDLSKKREILAAIFMAKDEQGEYVLAEGSLENPKIKEYIKNSNKYFGGYTGLGDDYKCGQWSARAESLPPTLRDLFLQNCFGQTEQNIENLKLINW